MLDGWTSRTLGELIEIKHGWPFKSELFSEQLTGRPIVVAVGNFRYSGGFRFSDTLTKEYLGDYPKAYELSPDDILLIMTCQTAGGEILGVPAKVPNDGRTYLHNQRLGKVVPKDPEACDLGYLYWVFLWSEFNKELVTSASGTKILHTAPSRIEAFRFRLPPLKEQIGIGALLSALSDKIELNRRMNKTLEAMGQAIFKDWFVDFGPTRAKIEGRAPYLVPDIWSLFPDKLDDNDKPKGWVAKPLDQIAKFLNGLALQKYPATGDAFLPVIKIAQLRAGSATSADRASPDIPESYVVEDGDILFSWSGSLLHRVWTGGRGALNQHLFKVSSDRYPKWFYFHWIGHHMPSFQATAASKATTMGHIQRHHLAQATTVVADQDLMRAADALIGPLFDRCVTNEIESQTLAAARDLLLPKLMLGEIRVKDAEKVVGEAT